jgi:hypothetical protein
MQRGEINVGCPNDAEDEVTVAVNNVPYIIPMCGFHAAEHARKAAEARNRRNARNREVAQAHMARQSSHPSRG